MADEMKRGPGRPPKPFTVVQSQEPVKAAPAALPASVTLEHPYAYYAGDGLMRAWPAGLVVTDPVDIADLIARGAPLKG